MVFGSRPPTCSGLGFSDSKSKGDSQAHRPLTRAAVHSPKRVPSDDYSVGVPALSGLAVPVCGPPRGFGVMPGGHHHVSAAERSVHIDISPAVTCRPSPSKFTIQVHMRELGSQYVAWQVLLQGNASVVNAVPA